MQEEMKTHKMLLSFIAGWIVIFLAVLFLLGAHHEQARLEAEALLVLNLTVCSALGYVGLAELILSAEFAHRHRRELLAYIGLGVLCLTSSIGLTFMTHTSLGLISLIVSPHAVLFGVMQLRLGSKLGRHPNRGRTLMVCGLIEILCGIALACGFILSDTNVLLLLAVTATSSLLQLLPFVFFSPAQAHGAGAARSTETVSPGRNQRV